MGNEITLVTSDVMFGTESQMSRRRDNLKLSATERRRSLKASAEPRPDHKPAKNLADLRQRWRPKVGPGKEIPQKFTEPEATDFEELEKKRIEKIRTAWRPAIGPASTI